jgi:hypothetical protein
MSDKTIALPIYVTEKDREVIFQAADNLGKATASELVREALIEYMVKHNQKPISNAVTSRRGGNRRRTA